MGHHDGEPKECDIYVRDWPDLEPMVLVKEISWFGRSLDTKEKAYGMSHHSRSLSVSVRD